MECIPLVEILAEIPDFRKAKGKRHRLLAILALACAAMMCGYQSYGAITEWGRNYDRKFTKTLGFIHKKIPCAATFHTIFRNIDGKTLCGSLKQEANITHLLSAVSHKLGLTLAQCSVDFKNGDKTNEIGVMPEVLQNLALEGKIITADAMHTQRKTCETIVDE